MAQAKWFVEVDWDDDGSYEGGDEDVTADVRQLEYQHMRDLRSEAMPPAELEVWLNNSDHKYSPPNSASALSGDLLPGRSVRLTAVYPYDSFTDTAGVQLANHTPDQDSNFAWTEQLNNFDIASGGAAAETDSSESAGDCVATLDFEQSDLTIGSHFSRGTDTVDHGGLCFRFSDTSNYLYARVTGSAIEVRKVEAGSDSLVASASHTWATSTSKLLLVIMHGDDIKVVVDGTLVLETSSSFNNTATKHGLFANDEADHQWLDFGGWATQFTGEITSIKPLPQHGNELCLITAKDEANRIANRELFLHSSAQPPQTGDEIAEDILDMVNVDSTNRIMDTGAELVPSLWSPPMVHNFATDELRRLQEEDDSFLYVDGLGIWRYENRTHRDSAPHTTSQATYEDAPGASNPFFTFLAWDDGVENVENRILISMRDADNGGVDVVFSLTEIIQFDADEIKTLLCQISFEDSGYDFSVGVLTPAENTDYEANTQSDGGGTDISSEITVERINGTYETGIYEIKVTWGSTAGYLTLLQLRSLNSLTWTAPLALVDEDSSSQTSYGIRTRSVGQWATGTRMNPKGARWVREQEVGAATIASRLARRKDPLTVLEIEVPARSKENIMNTAHRVISDRVTVDFSDMGINDTFYIEGKAWSLAAGGAEATCRLLLRETW